MYPAGATSGLSPREEKVGGGGRVGAAVGVTDGGVAVGLGGIRLGVALWAGVAAVGP